MDRSAPDRRRSRPGCPCLREARPEDTQGARSSHNRDDSTRPGPAPVLPVRPLRSLPLPVRPRWSLPLLRPLLLPEAHRHGAAEPRAARTPDEPSGPEPLGLLHRERSGGEHVPLGTAEDDGALQQVLESLPQEPRPAATRLTTKATLRDQRDDPPGGTPAPPDPSPSPPPYAPTPAPRSPVTPLKRHQAPGPEHLGPDMRYSGRAFGHRLRISTGRRLTRV